MFLTDILLGLFSLSIQLWIFRPYIYSYSPDLMKDGVTQDVPLYKSWDALWYEYGKTTDEHRRDLHRLILVTRDHPYYNTLSFLYALQYFYYSMLITPLFAYFFWELIKWPWNV